MTTESLKSIALATLCAPGSWNKKVQVSTVFASFADFVVWHKSEVPYFDPYERSNALWVIVKSLFGIRWLVLSPAIVASIPREEIGYFKEFIHDEIARSTIESIIERIK